MTKVVNNFDKVLNDIKRKLTDSSVKRKTLSYIANFEVAQIKDRTQNKGKDYQGNPFIPYSKRYTRRLVKESGHVDLTDTGQMFSSLTYKLSGNKANLFFARNIENKKAYFHDVAGVGKKKVKRKFFRLSEKEKDLLSSVFMNQYAKSIKLNLK
jgi:hypothetical protein